MAIEIEDLPIENGGSFHSYVVCLPEDSCQLSLFLILPITAKAFGEKVPTDTDFGGFHGPIGPWPCEIHSTERIPLKRFIGSCTSSLQGGQGSLDW